MIYAYPVKGKAKARDICEAFVEGCGEGVMVMNAQHADDGPSFFYGVDESNLAIWQAVRNRDLTKYPYYYCDNAYFDSTRQEYFRVTKNGLQHDGNGISDGARFRSLGVEIKPWQYNENGHIVVCPQSDPFMRNVVRHPGDWLKEIMPVIEACYLEKEIRVRGWNRDKTALAKTLPQDLEGAYALVTWSSAAAMASLSSTWSSSS